MTRQRFAVLGGSLPWFAAGEEMDRITLRRDDKKAAKPPVFHSEQADGCHHGGA
jgi:hypothetical protein